MWKLLTIGKKITWWTEWHIGKSISFTAVGKEKKRKKTNIQQ